MFKDFHVCIQVSDIERSGTFYQRLGFSLLTELQHEDADVAWRYLRHPNSGTLLELLHFKTAGATRLPTVKRRSLRGLNHIGFHVEDLDELKSVLESMRVEIVEQGARARYRYLFARGPDGELIGFAELGR